MVAASLHGSAMAGAEPLAPRAVRIWLLALIFLVFAMVLVGGATRLTESGLSITEWNLVTGTLPPLSEAVWQAEFDLYRQTPQYDLLNRGMSLEAFKTIYWWEWAHRQLGRFIGLVYLAGFVWIAMRRALPRRQIAVLTGIGVLLALQGAVGWIMVASGLQPGMIAVAPIRLTLHLTLACLLFAALVAVFVRLGGAHPEPASRAAKWGAGALVLLAFVQIAFGGLMAGHDAGRTYDTWPLMDGRFVPSGVLLLEPLWRNVVENVTTIQFNHRMGGYVLAAAVVLYALAIWRGGAPLRGRALLAVALVALQIAVGVATLLHGVPIGLALAHQGLALVLLLTLVWNAAVPVARRS